MNTHILGLRKKSCEFEKGLGDPKKVFNLSPLFLIQSEVILVVLGTKLIKC